MGMSLMLISVIAIHYSVCAKISLADDVSPLSGTQQQWPHQPPLGYYDPDLARLLDVGACSDQYNDSDISFVPPLDGTEPLPSVTLCLRSDPSNPDGTYAMNFVLFDLELVKLKAVDPVAGTFTAQLQMVLHWMEAIGPGSDGTVANSSCGFLCDTTSPGSRCCDQIWVPSLRLPECTTNTIHSIIPRPSVYSWPSDLQLAFNECLSTINEFQCSWRRQWYLNIDATCTANMNFRNFPYDAQDLTIDVLNPYASRTWLQLNRGFLKNNVAEGIDGVDLSPDHQIPGWHINDLMVSSSCDKLQTWQQTFLAQDDLLWELSDKVQGYTKQQDEIRKAFTKLECAEIKNLGVADYAAFTNPANMQPYKNTSDGFKSRLHATLEVYTECVRSLGHDFYLNVSLKRNQSHLLGSGGPFSLSEANLNRTFGLLDLLKEQPTKVWLPCAIEAVANLTTPGIRITILVRRYSKFYVVKLILPTVACVLFAFSAFGLPVDDLLGRLTVVVPSAIALAALQGLVVSTDIPAVTYIAPTTYMVLYSYLAQLLIAFESIAVKWMQNLKKSSRSINPCVCMCTRPADQPYKRLSELEMQRLGVSSQDGTSGQRQTGEPLTDEPHVASNNNGGEPRQSNDRAIKIFDRLFMVFVILLYTTTIVSYTVTPWVRSEKQIHKEMTLGRGMSMWQNDGSG